MFKSFIERLAEVTPFRIPSRKFFVYGLLTTIVVILLYHLGGELREDYAINTDTIIAFVRNAGSWSWIAFVFLVTLTVLSPLPSSALGLIGGYLFAPHTALVLILIGELIGASINFYIGKYVIGRLLTKERFPTIFEKIKRYSTYLTGKTVFLLGLVPAGTANVTGYTAGLIGMRYQTYIVAWSLGIMTLSVLTTFLGHSAQQRNYMTSILLGAGVVLFLLFGKRYIKRLTNRLQQLFV